LKLQANPGVFAFPLGNFWPKTTSQMKNALYLFGLSLLARPDFYRKGIPPKIVREASCLLIVSYPFETTVNQNGFTLKNFHL
jgi:hypothetical protein